MSSPNSDSRNGGEFVSPGELFSLVDLRQEKENGEDKAFFDALAHYGAVLRIELFPSAAADVSDVSAVSDVSEPFSGDLLLAHRLISVGRISRVDSLWYQEDPFRKIASVAGEKWCSVQIRVGASGDLGELPFNLGVARSFYRRIVVDSSRLSEELRLDFAALWPMELVLCDEETPPQVLKRTEKKRGTRLVLAKGSKKSGKWQRRNRFTSEHPEELARAVAQWSDERFLRRHPAHWMIRWSRRAVIPLAILVVALALATPLELRPERRMPVGDSSEGDLRFSLETNDPAEGRRLARWALYKFNRRFPSENEIVGYLKKTLARSDVELLSDWKWKSKAAAKPLRKGEKVKLNFSFPTGTLAAYTERERLAFYFYTSLFSDSIAYPTDYWSIGSGSHRRHDGIDLAAAPGTIVTSPISGKAFAGEGFLGGVFIGVQDGKRAVLMAHCDMRLFFEGDSVRAGDPLATVGMTGRTSGPHIHLMTGVADPAGKNRAGNLAVRWIDPVEWYHRELAR